MSQSLEYMVSVTEKKIMQVPIFPREESSVQKSAYFQAVYVTHDETVMLRIHGISI